MNDRVGSIEQLGRQLPDVAEDLLVQQNLRQGFDAGEAMAEEARVETKQFRVRDIFAQEPREDRADISYVAGNQYPHSLLLRFAHQTFQGALPEAQRSSRCRLSLSVSVGCQKPLWK
jgi:hypothetical protein